MKFKKYTIQAIIITLGAFPLSAFSQSDYLVNLKGDTIKGDLRFLLAEQIDKIQIIIAGKKTTYTGLQIRAFGKNGAVYKPLRYENSIRFMKLLKDGYLSYYSFNLNTPDSWDGRFLSKKDGTGLEVPNLGFKKTMAHYLNDCPEMTKRFEKGDFAKKDIERIIDIYNQCIEAKPSPASAGDRKSLAVKDLIAKIEKESFLTKKDALEALNDIQTKVSKNEEVPNYLFEGLKSYLAESPSLSKDLEALITLLKK